jgi:hypothetical protein
VLGALLAPSGRRYLGVDANHDMLRAARKQGLDVVEADVVRDRISGRFDTVTMLGNALAHFPVADMDRLLSTRRANVRPGATFIVDYRDLVAMFWEGTWPRVRVTTGARGKTTHRARQVDLRKGTLDLRSRPSTRKWVLDWSHAIWSPFILEPLMRRHGWLLARRTTPQTKAGASKKTPEYYVDVYRLEATRA